MFAAGCNIRCSQSRIAEPFPAHSDAWPAVRPAPVVACRTHVPFNLWCPDGAALVARPPPACRRHRPRFRTARGSDLGGRPRGARARRRDGWTSAPRAAATRPQGAPARCGNAAPSGLRRSAPRAKLRAGAPRASEPPPLAPLL